MIQREKTAILSVSLPRALHTHLIKYAKKNDIPASQIVTQSLKGYLFMEEWANLRKAFRPLAKKLKIKSDSDVEKIFG